MTRWRQADLTGPPLRGRLSRRIARCAVRRGGPSGPPDAQNVAAAGRQGRLFPPEDLGLLEAPDRDAWQKPEQIMDALGDRRRVSGRRHRRRRRLVHDPAGAPRRSERHRLRAGRAAADARSHPAARRARRTAERADAARRRQRAQPSERALDAVLVVDVYPEVEGATASRSCGIWRRAEARRTPRHRELQAGARRTGARAGRRRPRRQRERRAGCAGRRPSRPRPRDPSLSIPARSGPVVQSGAERLDCVPFRAMTSAVSIRHARRHARRACRFIGAHPRWERCCSSRR